MNSKSNQAGFSLIELLVVVTIMALLAGVGSSIYTKTKYIEEVNNAAHDIEGLIMEAQSKAKGSLDKNVLGYQVQFDFSNNQVKLNQLNYNISDRSINDLRPGEVGEEDFSQVEIKTVELSEKVTVGDRTGVYSDDSRVADLDSVSVLSKSGRLVYNNGIEPDLGQGDKVLFSPFDGLVSNRGSQVNISLNYVDNSKNFSKSVIIYLTTGKVEVANLN